GLRCAGAGVQPQAGSRQRGTGARRGHLRPRHGQRRRRSAHRAPRRGVRRVRCARTGGGAGDRRAPGHAALARRRGGGARGAGDDHLGPALPRHVGPGAGRHGHRERPAPLAGQAPLPGPGRAVHRPLHHLARHRADRGVGADGPGGPAAGLVAVGPRRVGGGRRRCRGAVAVPGAPRRRPPPRAATCLAAGGGSHPAGLGDGPALRPAVGPGVRRVRLVRPGVPRRRVLRRHRRTAAGGRHRNQHPAVPVAAGRCRPGHRPDQADAGAARLLPRRLPRAGPAPTARRLAVGAARRHGEQRLPRRARPHRDAQPHLRRHRGALRVHPERRVRRRGGGSLRRGGALRGHGRLDLAAADAHGDVAGDGVAGHDRRQAGRHRGRAGDPERLPDV
ncbi:MAG: hypothetical protein AVDCRST_MAG34-3218, partial [uncultured Nocardioidaceae bacterium]